MKHVHVYDILNESDLTQVRLYIVTKQRAQLRKVSALHKAGARLQLLCKHGCHKL
jgi:hypothetical protein